MDMRHPAASNLVRSLVEQALGVARKDGADHRAVQLHPLAEDTRVLRLAPVRYTCVLPLALANLGAKTLVQLEKDLALLIQAPGANARGEAIRSPS